MIVSKVTESDDFWTDDAAAIAERERKGQDRGRMPTSANANNVATIQLAQERGDSTRNKLELSPLWTLVIAFVTAVAVIVTVVGYMRLADDRFSTADLDAITVGMSKLEVETKLGTPTATILSIGNREVVQWKRGKKNQVSSISVSYEDGSVTVVDGSNLKSDLNVFDLWN